MSKYFKAYNTIKNLVTGGSKTLPTINKVKPTVNTTKLEKKISEATKAVQKAKGSGAKLSQSIFELKNNMPITFKGNKTKTLSNTTKKRNEESKKMFKTVESKKDGGRMGLKFGSRPKTNIEKINQTFNAKKSDLDKDGKLSGYEKKRGKAIAQAMKNKKKII
jgi:hypothetical protein